MKSATHRLLARAHGTAGRACSPPARHWTHSAIAWQPAPSWPCFQGIRACISRSIACRPQLAGRSDHTPEPSCAISSVAVEKAPANLRRQRFVALRSIAWPPRQPRIEPLRETPRLADQCQRPIPRCFAMNENIMCGPSRSRPRLFLGCRARLQLLDFAPSRSISACDRLHVPWPGNAWPDRLEVVHPLADDILMKPYLATRGQPTRPGEDQPHSFDLTYPEKSDGHDAPPVTKPHEPGAVKTGGIRKQSRSDCGGLKIRGCPGARSCRGSQSDR